MTPLEERFWSKVDTTGDCRLWTASRTKKGYGRFNVQGKLIPAVRVAWELLIGEFPKELVPDHLCRNPPCVNVGNHIEPVTRKENSRRGFSLQAINARKTHCPQGHPYDEKNTYRWSGNNTRDCRACHRVETRESQKRRRAAWTPERQEDERRKNRERMRGYRLEHPPTSEQKERKLYMQRERRRAESRHRMSLTIHDGLDGLRSRGSYPFAGGR